MPSRFFEGDFHLPAHHKPLNDLVGRESLVSTQQKCPREPTRVDASCTALLEPLHGSLIY